MIENGIPYKYFNEVLEIDDDSKTGLRWKERKSNGNFNKLFAKKEAGFVQVFGKNKYYIVKIAHNGRSINFPAHRIVMILSKGKINGKIVTHKDGNGLNNSVKNLQVRSHSEFLSSRSKQKNNHSGFKNVVKINDNKFLAQFSLNGKKYYIGYFDNSKDANTAVLERRKQIGWVSAKWFYLIVVTEL